MSEEFKDFVKQLEIVGKIPYLKSFKFEDRKTLAQIASLKTYGAGEEILGQGELNLVLYFLIRGKVDVFIDGKFIKSFRGGGQLFGEMSFVSHTVTSAAVKANTDAVMMCLKIQDILDLNEEEHCRLHKNLYRCVAEILANKLVATNELAKSFAAPVGEDDIA